MIFPKYDIITIGTATYDVFLKSDLFKPIKDPRFKTGKAECFAFGGKIEIGEPVYASGGGATNAAVTFSRQGFRTAALYRISDDDFGRAVINDMNHEGIKSLVVEADNLGTGYSTILLSSKGERSILVYRGAGCCLAAKEIPFNKLRTKWFYIVPSAIDFSVMKKIADYGHKKGIKMAINPSSHYVKMGAKKLRPLLSKMSVVLMNREEASYLTGVVFDKKEEIFKSLIDIAGGVMVVMTDGKKGSWIYDGSKVYKCGIFKEKRMIDRTGAGDAFGSGFVVGLMRDYEIKKAAMLGSKNAASVVSYIGAKEGIIKWKS